MSEKRRSFQTPALIIAVIEGETDPDAIMRDIDKALAAHHKDNPELPALSMARGFASCLPGDTYRKVFTKAKAASAKDKAAFHARKEG
ncbi:MAG: hypothetical protein IJ055_09610 [Oscillospiraceae bacterium]|nr:hypothetical protein [Oscillospiraceae bacterium]